MSLSPEGLAALQNAARSDLRFPLSDLNFSDRSISRSLPPTPSHIPPPSLVSFSNPAFPFPDTESRPL
jgi:hypothetical protein